MKKSLLALGVSLFFISTSAQVSDSLKLGKSNREFFIKGGQTYKYSEYKKVFSNSEALKYAKRARSNSTLGQIFGFTGGALMGAGLVKALQKDETVYFNIGYGSPIPYTYKRNQGGWALVGVGAGVTIIGIVINSGTKKTLQKAIDIENGTGSAPQAYYKVGFTDNGVSLSYNF